MTTLIYDIENLCCANCAAKIERKIQELPQVEEAVLTFTLRKLEVKVTDDKDLLSILQEIVDRVEDGVVLREHGEAGTRKRQSPECSCGHHHEGEGHHHYHGKSEHHEVHGHEAEHHHEAEHTLHDKEKQDVRMKNPLHEIFAGVGFFAVACGIQRVQPVFSILVFLAAYGILGGKILWKAWKNLCKGHVFDENFLMGIATLAAFSIGEYPEAVGIMLFYRIGEWFEEQAVTRSREKILAVGELKQEVVQLVTDDGIKTIPTEDAKIGDMILIRVGDRIPLDGRVVHGNSRIDTSAVTGESVPVSVGEGDSVLSGCMNTSAVLQICVEKTLEDSMVTRILQSVEHAAASKPKIDRFITRFARIYTPVVVMVAAATALIPSVLTGNWQHWIYTAITFLVISCPCALVLSVPLAFFSGIGAGSKSGILFKGGVVMEALQGVKVVVLDKTGTVTNGDFSVQRVVTVGEWNETQVLQLAASLEQYSTHPIAESILKRAEKEGISLETPVRVEEISGKGMRGFLQDREVLCGSFSFLQTVNKKIVHPSTKGVTSVAVSVDGKLAGYLEISDTVKPDAKEAVQRMKRRGIVTYMLTGDERETAEHVAKEIGIDHVYSRLMPQEKLEYVERIRTEYGKVLFVGDGMNDAPVLAGADVGASMGSGADAAIEAADVVFMTSQVQAIPQAMQVAEYTNRIAVQNVVFALTLKLVVMVLGFLGIANMWLAVFADTGVAIICVLNSIRALYKKFK